MNVDQLPVYDGDPFDMLPNRDHHHKIERMRLDSFCEGFNLDVLLPEMAVGSPGGPFDHQCTVSPITRIPVGLQALRCVPSLLDYALSEPEVITKLWTSWIDVPADHAWLFGEAQGKVIHHKPPRKTIWK